MFATCTGLRVHLLIPSTSQQLIIRSASTQTKSKRKYAVPITAQKLAADPKADAEAIAVAQAMSFGGNDGGAKPSLPEEAIAVYESPTEGNPTLLLLGCEHLYSAHVELRKLME